MLLRSKKSGNRKLMNINMDVNGDESRLEGVVTENSDQEKEKEDRCELLKEEEDSRFEQIIELVREVNRKVDREMEEIRKDFRRELEEVFGEVRELKNIWEEEMRKMRRDEKEREGLGEKVRQKVMQEGGLKKIEENRKLITALYEDMQ